MFQAVKGHRALRLGRVSRPRHIYLVTTATRGRQPVFRNFEAARVVIRALRHCQEKNLGRVLAFVVMPDHVHCLVQLTGGGLAEFVRQFKGRSSHGIGMLGLQLKGPCWQRAYHDHAMRKGEDVVAAARYVIANPLRAGLVRRLGDYPHWDSTWLPGSDDVPL